MARIVSVVPHTHWDREWYEPFQTFRLRLVDLLDELLPILEADPSYAHFQLDGQMAVVDDYLAVRPERRDDLRRLAAAERLSMGPWYALPDEFLVSGETLVRDLQLGIVRATEFGGPMEVGYLPDMFGHVAQMPQILAQFGLDDAVVWRGVPAAVDASAFWWEAPDGSTVRAEYLPEGYGNGAYLPDDAKELLERVRRFEEQHGAMLRGPILWMNGTDHLMPQPWLGRVLAEANAISEEHRFEVVSLAEHVARAAREGLPRWHGELRSGARANLLMGVASNRVDVKQAAARAERGLERLAEPLSALLLPPERWPARLLEEAWLQVVRNAAHDSVCACSVDEVCDAVLVRYAEAEQIAEGLTDRALRRLAKQTPADTTRIVNPSARTRSGIVELRLPGEGAPEGLQLVSQRPTELVVERTRDEVFQLVASTLEHQAGFHDAEVRVAEGGVLEVVLHRGRDRRARLPASEVLERMHDAGGDPETLARLVLRRPPVRHVLARAEAVPGLGWRRWEPEALRTPPVRTTGSAMDNGLVRVEVDPSSATFSVNGHAGLGRLVDGGDGGDTYNYDEPAEDLVVDTPEEASVTVLEEGPLRARLALEARYPWPERLEGGRRVGRRETTVRTQLELRAGESLVRVGVRLDNQCRDHRLRAWFPLPQPATTSEAECAYAVVSRGLEAEGGPTERALPTYPSRRFVRAGGLTVLHEGLLEYELVDVRDDAAHALALTLLRCTGLLSQGPMRSRPLPAGPIVPVESAQMVGPQELRYALHLGDGDPYALADEAFLPLLVVSGTGAASAEDPDADRLLEVTGAEVAAVRREGRALQVRVFNPSAEPTTVRLPGRAGWVVDLRGRPVEPFEGEVALGAWRIATLQLGDEPTPART